MNATVSTVPAVPDLRQSLVEVMACPESYVTQVIDGQRMPGGMQSARGTEIHDVWGAYLAWCAINRTPADWAQFDRLALGAGQEAAGILNGIRDNYAVDWVHFYAAELTLSSDVGHASGRLDALFLYQAEKKAKIEDAKSHPRPFDPAGKDQAMRYSFLVFENFPDIEEVEFELIFVRYPHCRRSITFTRAKDYLNLRQQMVNSRERQEDIHRRHANGETLPALPGPHCVYCPLAQRTRGVAACPIGEVNPYTSESCEDRARFAVWLRQVKKVNDQVLKDVVDRRGQNIVVEDANGRPTQVGFVSRESFQFPLLKVLPHLLEYKRVTPDDIAWLDKLVIGATKLKSYLKAKKRSFLQQSIQDTAAEQVTKVKFDISAPPEQQEEEERGEYEEE